MKGEFDEQKGSSRGWILILIFGIVIATLLGVLIWKIFLPQKEEQEQSSETQTEILTTEAMAGMEAYSTEETVLGETSLLSNDRVARTAEQTYGIDVARYQGTIDWKQVADSGVTFAIVRVGYRTQDTGIITEDSNGKYNMQEAQANGIKVGVYFFSTAITQEEAKEEADWVADLISQYKITYPVTYNCEGFTEPGSRQYALTQTQRSQIAMAFLDEIYVRGYTPMFYASRNELAGEALWDTSAIEQKYQVWLAYYPTVQAEKPDYEGAYTMWQYTNQGTVPGIEGKVDLNLASFGYEGVAEAFSGIVPETVAPDVEALMDFEEVNETVTAKQEVNLRDKPSQGEDSTITEKLVNGEVATRTGISDSGWSRISYNGMIYYAVSNFLTTDLSAAPQEKPEPVAPEETAGDEPGNTDTTAEGAGSGDGLKTQFTPIGDAVTAKIEVNLRALPSVTNPDAVVVAVLHNGEVVTRTGYNEDYGWSRVDYNGQTLYCISSYLTPAE